MQLELVMRLGIQKIQTNKGRYQTRKMNQLHNSYAGMKDPEGNKFQMIGAKSVLEARLEKGKKQGQCEFRNRPIHHLWFDDFF